MVFVASSKCENVILQGVACNNRSRKCKKYPTGFSGIDFLANSKVLAKLMLTDRMDILARMPHRREAISTQDE
jgi:hypothetical protein